MSPRAPKLTPEFLAALMDRSRYELVEGPPADGWGRCEVRCLLCGERTSVRVSSLVNADRQRAALARHPGSRASVRREACAHQQNPAPRPPKPISQTEAEAVITALHGVAAPDGTPLGRAIAKLRRIADR